MGLEGGPLERVRLHFVEFGPIANTASVDVVSSQPAHALDTEEEVTTC